MAFIIAGIVFVCFLGFALLQFGAAMMSDAPSQSDNSGCIWTFFTGLGISAIIASSHWWHVSW